MKFSFAPLIALALVASTSVMGLPDPAPAAPGPIIHAASVGKRRTLEKRTNSGRIEVDGLKYRTCPGNPCTALGQYPIGTHIDIVCYTRDDTLVINGDAGWAKLTTGNWVSLSFGQYVSWTGAVPYC